MDTAQKYKRLREMAATIVTREFVRIYPNLEGHLRITDIDGDALRFLKHQWKNHPDPARNVGTPDNWRDHVRSYRTSYSNRIEAAIWHDDHLCALLLGKCSRGKFIARIKYLQGNYDDNYLIGKRVHIATRLLEVFAVANEIEWVGIQDPYLSAEPLYRAKGYNTADPFDYHNHSLCKKL